MHRLTTETITAAESLAASESGVDAILRQLRKLSLDDFGQFLISLPDAAYPHLSRILPRMASAEVQDKWTGMHGWDLLRTTTTFARQCENNFWRYAGKSLAGATIMDFGCGYGRNIRSMYYYADPNRIWGVDAWESSLDISRADGVLANLVKSASVPKEISVPEESIDFGFAFSVFTHLSKRAAEHCLDAILPAMKPNGLFVVTIRPVEYWLVHDQVYGASLAETMTAEHETTGFAHQPHNNPGSEYGDSSIDLRFFEREGWEVCGYDSTILDDSQISVILKRRPNVTMRRAPDNGYDASTFGDMLPPPGGQSRTVM